ncbi:MAG: hypothetical protein ABL872_14770 [Lacibacter sp.]
MNKKWIWLLLIVVFAACKAKKPKTITDEDLTVADFIALAPSLTLPVSVNDSMLIRKEKDSALINQTAFKTFLTDTVFKKFYPQTKQLKLYLVGKATDDKKGNYIIVKSVNGKSRGTQLFYFTKKDTYLGGMKLIDNLTKSTGRYFRIDNRFNISMIQEKRVATGEIWTNETIYFMNDSGRFIIAMTNSNEDLSDEIMGNPIDTFAKKNKFSADYTSDKKNLVSIRDGSSAKTFQLFIHFSKQNGECIGEIKGEGEWIDKTRGIFRDGNSDCAIEFNFGSSSVTIKEQNGCGSYRDITCFFEGSYPRKKEPVQPKAKSKSKKKK